MKTIAITGALGYSGRYIAREAAKLGWRVIGLTNSAGRLPNPAGWELRPMPWTTQESILINNMAWSLRHLPAVATFGWGHYQLRPLHVQDFAEAALKETEQTTHHRVIQATGQETYTFRALWELLAKAMGIRRPILPVPADLGYAATSLLGHFMNDIMLTLDEIRGLCENRLAVPGCGIGTRPLSQWVLQHADTLGRTYESELARRK